MKSKARFPTMLLITAGVVLVDHFIKQWFIYHYQLGESHAVTSFFSWTLVHNTGTAFGLLQNNNRALLAISYVILASFLYAARGLWERARGWAFIGVSLIMGGAIGNIVDRHLYGHVIDFIDFHFWPVFNIADSAITIGAIATGIGLLFGSEKK